MVHVAPDTASLHIKITEMIRWFATRESALLIQALAYAVAVLTVRLPRGSRLNRIGMPSSGITVTFFTGVMSELFHHPDRCDPYDFEPGTQSEVVCSYSPCLSLSTVPGPGQVLSGHNIRRRGWCTRPHYKFRFIFQDTSHQVQSSDATH
ncbi:hypothetical protein F5146DRAFT_73789 [Armillaria mellea]|nr:hypothetical protein F5146DRAFT_73789 [Armillaria mellea]